jgi:hypothetical protein
MRQGLEESLSEHVTESKGLMSYLDDKQREQQIREDFANHVATTSTCKDHIGEFITLEWAKPGTNNCRVVYLLRGSILLVYGDLGEAIYQWGGHFGGQTFLAFLSGCSLDYFASKCQASDDGSGGKNWDEEYAKFKFIKCYEGHDVPIEKIREYLSENTVDFSKWEFIQFLVDAPELEENGVNAYELGTIGERESWRTHAHLIGLKMAHDQLKKRNSESKAPDPVLAEFRS